MNIADRTCLTTDVDVFPLRLIRNVLIAVSPRRMDEFSVSLLDADRVRTGISIAMMCSYVVLRTFGRVKFELNRNLILIQPIHQGLVVLWVVHHITETYMEQFER